MVRRMVLKRSTLGSYTFNRKVLGVMQVLRPLRILWLLAFFSKFLDTVSYDPQPSDWPVQTGVVVSV